MFTARHENKSFSLFIIVDFFFPLLSKSTATRETKRLKDVIDSVELVDLNNAIEIRVNDSEMLSALEISRD